MMRYLKMLGLAAIAAASLMAFLGVGTASATVLCETTPAAGFDCEGLWKVQAGVNLDFSASTTSVTKDNTVKTTGPFGETISTCGESTLEFSLAEGWTGSTTTTPTGPITKLTFADCTSPKTVAKAGTIEIHHIAGTDNGTVTSTGMVLEVHNVPFFGTCTYETNNTDIGILTGRTTTKADPTLDLNGQVASTNGCPKTTLEGSYVYTGTTTFDVAAG